MSKLAIYCKKCGQPNHYVTDKPRFCQSCAQPFDETKGATNAPPVERNLEAAPPLPCTPLDGSLGIEENEESFESNLNKLDVDVETWDEQGTPLGAIMAANPNTKPPKDNSGKTKKPKRGSKKQFLNEWEKEAGSIRKQNE